MHAHEICFVTRRVGGFPAHAFNQQVIIRGMTFFR